MGSELCGYFTDAFNNTPPSERAADWKSLGSSKSWVVAWWLGVPVYIEATG